MEIAEVYATKDVGFWLESLQPTPELAVIELNRLREVDRRVHIQIAYIEGYIYNFYDLDYELDAGPEILKSPYDWEDEDD